MKTETNRIDYGVYIDRKQSFIIALNHFAHQELLSSQTAKNEGVLPRSTRVNRLQVHLQNERNEQLKKFCKSIIDRLIDADQILIFGPSTSKYELQKELKNEKALKMAKEQLKTTEMMAMEEAQRFVLDYYN